MDKKDEDVPGTSGQSCGDEQGVFRHGEQGT